MSNENWYGIRVRTRWEQSARALLSGKGYETLLPTYKARRRWAGRLREIAAPLFPGYVFCYFDVNKRLPVLVTPGVIAVVGRGRTPIPIEASEISSIQAMVASGLPIEPWPYLEIGQKVRIEEFALRGVEGVLIGFKGNRRIIVSISLLCRSVAVEIDRAGISPVGTASLSVPGPAESQGLLRRLPVQA